MPPKARITAEMIIEARHKDLIEELAEQFGKYNVSYK